MLALGSNQGPGLRLLTSALEHLERCLGPLERAPLYRSAPLSDIPQPDYLNTVALCPLGPVLARGLGPEDVLALGKALELAWGRRGDLRNGPRPLDVDLLLFGDRLLARPELTLPHPRLRRRRFVLQPLVDLRPGLLLPPDRRPARELLAELGTSQALSRLRAEGGPAGI